MPGIGEWIMVYAFAATVVAFSLALSASRWKRLSIDQARTIREQLEIMQGQRELIACQAELLGPAAPIGIGESARERH